MRMHYTVWKWERENLTFLFWGPKARSSRRDDDDAAALGLWRCVSVWTKVGSACFWITWTKQNICAKWTFACLQYMLLHRLMRACWCVCVCVVILRWVWLFFWKNDDWIIHNSVCVCVCVCWLAIWKHSVCVCVCVCRIVMCFTQPSKQSRATQAEKVEKT